MNKLFLRIYAKMLFITCIVCLLGLLAFNQISKIRDIEHTRSYLKGITTLVTEGLNRHQGDKQQIWFSSTKKLTGLNMRMVEYSEDSHPFIQIKTIKQNLKHVVFSINDTQAIEFEFEGLSRQLLEAMNRLSANYFGQTPMEERSKEIEQLNAQINTQINLIDPRELDLTKSEIEQLNIGVVIYRFNQTYGTTSGMTSYSKFDQEGFPLVLQVGPIAPFTPYPMIGILILIIIILSSSLLAGWFLFKPFTNRLKKLAEDVGHVGTLDDVGNTTLDITISQEGNDAFATLTQEVDQMANRVVSLVKEQQQMSRSISHEFRTPLAKMGYRIAMLNESKQLSDHHCETLRSYMQELHKMVDELLLFSSLEVNSHPDMTTFTINKMLKKLQEELQPLSEAKIEILCPEHFQVFGIESYWQTILQNLLTNAQRYAHSIITIQVEQLDNLLTVKVTDDGNGIQEENINKLFEPFFVEEQSRNKKMAGHGLGLSIVKRMTQVQHGSISVSNTRQGGAQFKLSFKLD